MNDINCPYCNAELDICHDDGYGYEEGEKHTQECSECHKTFVYTTAVIYHYEAEKADCLNEEVDHDWEPTCTIPKRYTKMRCSMCDEERLPTEHERKVHAIPDIHDRCL